MQGIAGRLQRVTQRNQEVEKLTRTLNTEYFEQRSRHDQELKRLQEEKELLRLKGISLKAELERVGEAKQTENHILENLGQKRAKDYAGEFAVRAANKAEALDRMKQQYKTVRKMLEEETAKLEGHVSELRGEIHRVCDSNERKIKGVRGECEKLRRQTRWVLTGEWGRVEGGSGVQGDETVELSDLDRLQHKIETIDRLL